MSQVPLIHPVTGQVSVRILAEQVTALRDRLIDEKAAVAMAFPTLNPTVDARLTCFAKLQNLFGSLQLGCAFWALNLMSPEWWASHTNYPDADRGILRAEYQMFLKIGFVQMGFSAVESSLRVFMRAVESGAHSGATVEFKRIYDDLLLKRLSPARPAHVELLDMAARTRNTVHNNGIYFHKSGNDADQPYKGRTYKFRVGKPVDVGGWPLVLEIAGDMVTMLADIVRDPVISGIGREIIDPGSVVKPG